MSLIGVVGRARAVGKCICKMNNVRKRYIMQAYRVPASADKSGKCMCAKDFLGAGKSAPKGSSWLTLWVM